jgi:protein-S-isoprenylcysteine O-methyltransferase Ste14
MNARKIIPPVYLLLSIAVMVSLHFLFPGATVLNFPWQLLGVIPLAVGIGFNLVADRSFKNYNTPVKPLEKSTTLVTHGVFRVSRNPMYLGLVLILLGIALCMGSLTPYLVVFLFAIFIDIVFIRFEEKKLEETFGEAWLEYTKSVRRWV